MPSSKTMLTRLFTVLAVALAASSDTNDGANEDNPFVDGSSLADDLQRWEVSYFERLLLEHSSKIPSVPRPTESPVTPPSPKPTQMTESPSPPPIATTPKPAVMPPSTTTQSPASTTPSPRDVPPETPPPTAPNPAMILPSSRPPSDSSAPSTPPTTTPDPAMMPPSGPPPTPDANTMPTPGNNTSSPTPVFTNVCCPIVRRIPGVTALEYLGAGYNILEGNPRGSLTTELDPGFRNGVIKLVLDQNLLTNNREFTVPLGTEHRYTTSCHFASKSAEVSTTDEYQRELSTEASVTRTTSASFNIFGLKFGTDSFFSRSEKYRSFARTRAETQTTTFDSRALCTEFEARLQRFYEHELQGAFLIALNSLPSTFDRENEEHRALFGDFVSEYGTHYVNYVVLGAKQVYSLEMNSLDVLSLREMNIEVSEATSSKVMFGFKRSAQVSKGGMIPGTPVNVQVNTDITSEGEVSLSNTMSETSSEEEMQLNMIRARTQRVVETNVGGTPPADGQWQTWAATAKDRPMPIVYELSDLTEFMTEDVQKAFFDYIDYFLEAGNADDLSIENALHYGVAQPRGIPISSYTSDPRSGQRTLTEYLPREDVEASNETQYHRYNFVWDGSEVHESAVFLTLIRDTVSPNVEEDTQELELIDGDQFPIGIQIPFGLRMEPRKATAAIFGVTDPRNLNSFSYLAADNIPSEATYIAGVVHPQGYPVNKIFGTEIGFEISQETEREFVVTFTTDFVETPTFLAFPLWFPMDSSYPALHSDVALLVRECNTTVCCLQVGASNPDMFDTKHLGFSFVAIDGSQRNVTGLVHGSITTEGEAIDASTGFGDKGFKASWFLVEGNGNVDIGFLVEFETKFQDIPSVIVTPSDKFVQGISYQGPNSYTLPSVYVEHVTTSQVLIRSSLVEVNGTDFEVDTTIGFTFVAVGPVPMP